MKHIYEVDKGFKVLDLKNVYEYQVYSADLHKFCRMLFADLKAKC